MSSGGRHRERHLGREAALQMLYQWEIGKAPPAEVVQTFSRFQANDAPEARLEHATAIFKGTVAAIPEIDPLIVEAAENWRLPRMATMDRLIIRMAVYEFLNEPETPSKVVINEALELARRFSTEDSVKFINGVLDAIRRRLEDSKTRSQTTGGSGRTEK